MLTLHPPYLLALLFTVLLTVVFTSTHENSSPRYSPHKLTPLFTSSDQNSSLLDALVTTTTGITLNSFCHQTILYLCIGLLFYPTSCSPSAPTPSVAAANVRWTPRRSCPLPLTLPIVHSLRLTGRIDSKKKKSLPIVPLSLVWHSRPLVPLYRCLIHINPV